MLTIYRRHGSDCSFHARKNQRSARANSCEKRCPIWVQGSLSGQKVRRSLDLRSWEAASDLIHSWNASGQIGVAKTSAPPVAEAVSKFISDAEARGLRASTIKKYRRLLDELLGFCKSKAYTVYNRAFGLYTEIFEQLIIRSVILRERTRSAGWAACWRAGRDWDSEREIYDA